MEEVRHHPTRLALDADTVAADLRQRRQRIVATRFDPVDVQFDADVLPGLKLKDRLLVHRAEIKRCDFRALLNAGRELELTTATPAARRCGFLVVDRRFGANQDIGQLTVRSPPGGQHLGRCNVTAQHFFDSTQQAGADNRVMLRQDLQGHVLVNDLGHQIAQLVELVDVARIHQHAIGQRTRLITAGLVRLIEQRAHLGVFRQHQTVKMGDQRFTAAFQQRHSGFDDGTILSSKHKVDS